MILPEWFAILRQMAKTAKSKGDEPLSIHMMPHNVATHWNSTYEMLNFAYIYHDAFNQITANQDMKMRKYELSRKEWKVVKDLVDVLKVRFCFKFNLYRLMFYIS